MDDERLVCALTALELSKLDKEWVEMMYSTEYTEEPDIDLNLPLSLPTSLQDFNDALRRYLKELLSSKEIHSSLLHSLAQVGITSKVIKAWLHYIFYNGLKLSADFQQRLVCLQAVNLYFLLLQLPGINSAELHQPILFDKSLDSLLLITHTQSDNANIAMQRKRKGKNPISACRKRRKQDVGSATQEDAESSMNENIVVLSAEDTCVLLSKLSSTLRDLCSYLASNSLRAHDGAVKQIIQTLVKLSIFLQSNCPVDLVDYSKFKPDGSTAETLSLPYQLTVYGLFLVVSIKHGDLDQVSLTLFRFIVQILLMKNATGSSIPRAYYQNSEIFRRLVCHLFDIHGDTIVHNISILTQNLIAHCPDRTEFRNHCSVLITCILNRMPLSWFAKFSHWLKRVAFHVKISYRSAAVAVFAKLLCQAERKMDDNEICNDQSLDCTTHGFMLSVVIGRLMDVAPSVRSRALAALVEIMEAGVVLPHVLRSAAGGGDKDFEVATPLVTTPGISETPPTLHSVPVSTYVSTDLTGASSLLCLLTKCSLETKSMVRKTAVHALEMAVNYGFVSPITESLDVISVRCRDPALMVRKFALGSITSVVLHHMDCAEAVSAWAKGVLPALHDIESTVQEKALKHIEALMFDGLFSSDNKKELAWRLMDFISSSDGECVEAYFKAACRQWKRQSKLDMALIHKIVDKLSDFHHSSAAWTFLQCYTLYKCDRDTAVKIYHVWTNGSLKESPLVLHINAIKVIGQVCNHLPEEMKRKAFDTCVAKLKSLKCPIQLVSYLVDTILHLIDAMHRDNPTSEDWPKPIMSWGEKILNQVDEFLYKFVILCANKDSFLNDESLIHQLHVAGNIGKHCAKKVSKRLILTIQALLTSPECLREVPQNTQEPSQSQGIPQSQPLSQFAQKGEVPQNIRAHAMISLGKLCLNNGMLAKKCVPAFVRELDTTSNDMIKVNILIVLTDLCVQQTQLVDTYIPDIANCLGDESVAVRRNALVLISSLLKKDYVKWRGSLIFKFLTLLCDQNEEIQQLAKYSLTNQILQRNSGDVFFRHFVESIFYLNAYTKHNTYNRFPKSQRELKLFDFSGTENISRRKMIYHYMLDCMDDEHRIKLIGKLCMDVLDAVVDGNLPLNQKTDPILADTLYVISSQEIKLRCMKPVEEDQIEDEVQANAAAATNAIKRKIISQVVKQNLLENIVPIIIALKNKLVSNKSHMVKNVMESLKEIMKDYKTEIQDVLAADKQLAAEIEFDLKRFNRKENLHKEFATRQADRETESSLHNDKARLSLPAGRHASEPAENPGVVRAIYTPMQQTRNGFPATPALQRTRGLGIEAMLNSARKAMNHLKLPDNTKKSKESNATRAISTPARLTALTDLTFSNLNEISVIRPSVEAGGT